MSDVSAPIISAMRKAAEAYAEGHEFDASGNIREWRIVRWHGDIGHSQYEIVSGFSNKADRDTALADIRMRAAVEAIGWAEMVEALKPFAEYAEWVSANHLGWDHDEFVVGLPDGLAEKFAADRLGSFRQARAVLKNLGEM